MKLIVVILMGSVILGLSGCVGGQLEISASPGFLLSQPIHTIKILNGTRYNLRLNYGKTIMIRSGGQVEIPYLKDHDNRKVVFSVSAMDGKKLIGTAKRIMRIPSYKRSSSNSEDIWHITRLKLIR